MSLRINKRSWHYKVWARTYGSLLLLEKEDAAPSKASLCQYVRQLFLYGPIFYLVAILLTIGVCAVALIVIPLIALVAALFGWLLHSTDEEKDTRAFVRYRGLRLRGREYYPAHVVMPAVAGYCLYAWIYVPFKEAAVDLSRHPLSGLLLGTLVALVLLGLAIRSIRRSLRWETGAPFLGVQYLRAKKEKICPLITFTEEGF